MQIIIIGAGAIGGYFGGRLAEAGLDVTFLVREKRAEQLRLRGLTIKSPFGDVALPSPRLALLGQEVDACDLVILAVKNYQLKEAIPQLRPLVEAGAKLLPLLNGVEHFDLLAKEFGQEAVLGGICHIISTIDSEGMIHHTNRLHNLYFGPLEPSQQKFCTQIQQALGAANLKIDLRRDILIDIWYKYAFITAFSGVTTASRLTIDQVLEVEATTAIYAQALEEMWTLARANGAMLADDFVAKNVALVAKNPKGSSSSMHQDFRKGLPLEVESLQGAAIRIASRLGMDVPAIRTLYGLIKPFEYGTPF